jgi:hypothetical protein
MVAMMRRIISPLILIGAVSLSRPMAAQSGEAICADTAVNARILGTGPVRAIITELQGLRVCVAAEGFTDSSAFHPNDWPGRSRLLVLETRRAGDVRRMQSSSVLTAWTNNGKPASYDAVAAAWRAAVLDLAAAQWDAAARYIELAELEMEIAAAAEQQAWLRAQIDTIKGKEDSLRVAVGQETGRSRLDDNQCQSSAQRLGAARASSARAALARIPRTPENAGRIREAEANVREADASARQPSRSCVSAGGAQKADNALDNLDAIGRIATLKEMLADLDADSRITSLKAALQAFAAQPDPTPRLLDAAGRIRTILGP